eukprot:798700-Amorphochlora_amoeboformis.AAC.2
MRIKAERLARRFGFRPSGGCRHLDLVRRSRNVVPVNTQDSRDLEKDKGGVAVKGSGFPPGCSESERGLLCPFSRTVIPRSRVPFHLR